MIAEEFLHPVSATFASLADLDGRLVDDELGISMHVEEVKLELPIELDVAVEEDGRVLLASAPPTQHVETTYMPVFHQLRLTVTPDGDS